MMRLFLLWSFLLGALAACSATAEVADWPTEGTAPRPYTAEQIRDAHPDGTELKFLVHQTDADAVVQVMRFGGATAEGTTVESWTETRDGVRVGASKKQRAGWQELRDHAAYDAALTARERSACSVKAGDYECWHYTVRAADKADQTVQHFYFAIDMPGPPVLLVVQRGDDEVLCIELLEYRRGK